MSKALSRGSDTLQRILCLCEDNHHDSRCCEELFNSHARTEGLHWPASSRAVLPEPAARNDEPMSLAAIEVLRSLGAAPVNHPRLPLEISEFDVRNEHTGPSGSAKLRPMARWASIAFVVACPVSTAGCGDPPTSEVLLLGSLGRAVRDVGYACEQATEAQEIDTTAGGWQVTCDRGLRYVASVRPDGSICIERESPADGDAARCTESPAP